MAWFLITYSDIAEFAEIIDKLLSNDDLLKEMSEKQELGGGSGGLLREEMKCAERYRIWKA